MKKCKEMHIYLDTSDIPCDCLFTFCELENAVEKGIEIIHTTILDYMRFYYAEKIFVHYKNGVHEIKVGKSIGTNRTIREGHNLQHLLITGEFSWFRADNRSSR